VLAAKNLEVVYDDVMLVLRGVGLEVPQGRIVALLGANGAGKSTLLRALSGLLDVHDGEVRRGSITLDGEPIHSYGASRIAALGIKQVMEGRRILGDLTVEDNLRIGGHVSPRSVRANLDRTYQLFPVLADRRRKPAGYLSGG
jgi:branched-chain amino acid transport system ATP-binding protein